MVYKKYITKNGKIYGPYTYHSKRIGGKVVSEYRGQLKEKRRLSKIFFIVLGLVIILSLAFWILFFKSQFSGRVVLNIDGELENSELISGNLNLILKNGELLPADTKIILKNNNETYEYNLREIIGETNMKSGNFYLDGLDFVGTGDGYGIEGEKQEIPTISFQLEIKDIPEEENSTSGISGESIETPEENQTEKPKENQTTEQPEENETEKPPIEEQPTIIEIPIKKPQEEIVPSITGNVVSNTFSSITNFLTGFATHENRDLIVNGTVSKNKKFTYPGTQDKAVRIVPETVKIKGELVSPEILTLTQELSDSVIETEHVILTKGFGEEFLNEEETALQINLSQLNLILKEGDLQIILVYNETELFTFEEKINEETLKQIIIEDPIEELEEILFNSSNTTIEEKIYFDLDLTEEEKDMIKARFDFPVVHVEKNTYKDKFLVLFSIGEYAMEKTYSEKLSLNELDENIERDQLLWLKDLINSFSEHETTPNPLEENSTNNYPIF